MFVSPKSRESNSGRRERAEGKKEPQRAARQYEQYGERIARI